MPCAAWPGASPPSQIFKEIVHNEKKIWKKVKDSIYRWIIFLQRYENLSKSPTFFIGKKNLPPPIFPAKSFFFKKMADAVGNGGQGPRLGERAGGESQRSLL
jgi:hypothetical protein